MRKKIAILLVVLSMPLLLCACGGQGTRYAPEDYILQTPYYDDYRILQFTDIHLANKDNRQRQYDFLDLSIASADPDLILVSGDLFTFADRTVARELFAWLDSHNVPWTVTFGNHDEQCYFSVDWLTNLLNSYGSNCLFRDLQDDDVFGSANFAINLMDGDRVHDQIILMDSNRYNYGEYFGYDYIKQDQIDWYERLVKYTSEVNSEIVNSLLFFHIPLPEFDDAWDAAERGDADAVLEYGEKREKNCPPEYNSGFFDKILELNSTKAICVGHDHVNNYRILYKGVYLSYGIDSTDRIYFDEDLLGGQVVVIHPDHSLSFEPVYHTYGEVAE